LSKLMLKNDKIDRVHRDIISKDRVSSNANPILNCSENNDEGDNNDNSKNNYSNSNSKNIDDSNPNLNSNQLENADIVTRNINDSKKSSSERGAKGPSFSIRIPKLVSMFASRACRSAIMIGELNRNSPS
jgi:hypothetical protein